MRILLVEDDLMIGDSLRQGLRGEGFTVDWVQDGPSAERALETTDYALVLLDLGLPRKDGLAVLGGWRRRGLTVPVLLERAGRHPGQLVGRTPYLQAIHVPSAGLGIGDLVPVAITECHAHSLGGVPAAGARTEREAYA